MDHLRDAVACLAAAGVVAVTIWIRYYAVRKAPKK